MSINLDTNNFKIIEDRIAKTKNPINDPNIEAIRQKCTLISKNLNSGEFIKNKHLRGRIKKLDYTNLDQYLKNENTILNKLRFIIHKIKLILLKTYSQNFKKYKTQLSKAHEKEIKKMEKEFLKADRKEIRKLIENEKNDNLLNKKATQFEIEIKKLELKNTEDSYKKDIKLLQTQISKNIQENGIAAGVKSTQLTEKFVSLKNKIENLEIDLQELNGYAKKLNQLSDSFKIQEEEVGIKHSSSSIEEPAEEEPSIQEDVSPIETEEPRPSADGPQEFNLNADPKDIAIKDGVFDPNGVIPSISSFEPFLPELMNKLDQWKKDAFNKIKIPLELILCKFFNNPELIEKLDITGDKNNFNIEIKLKNTLQGYLHQSMPYMDGGYVYNFGDNEDQEVVISCNSKDIFNFDVKGIDFYFKGDYLGFRDFYSLSISKLHIRVEEDCINQFYMWSTTTNRCIAKLEKGKVVKSTNSLRHPSLKLLNMSFNKWERFINCPINFNFRDFPSPFLRPALLVNGKGQNPLIFHETSKKTVSNK